MTVVRPKKNLGQHFLKDQNIAQRIVESLKVKDASFVSDCIEVGPGMGVLTQFLKQRTDLNMWYVDIDTESIEYLKNTYPDIRDKIVFADFLKMDLAAYSNPMHVIGNFPYNISSQIFFKVLENKDKVFSVVGMLQKEVAQRIAEPPGTKTYGILSVFLQAYYEIEYLFTVHENVFIPPPKVKSAVIRLTRNNTNKLDCDEQLFYKVVKTSFNQRRKTLRNSLKPILGAQTDNHPVFDKRPEQLSVKEFVDLTNKVEMLLSSGK